MNTQVFLKCVFSLAVILTLAGCGKFDRLDDGGFTTVTFDHAGQKLTSATLNGGVVIYASSVGYSTNLKISNDDVIASISLPNGVYTFYAFGFGVANGVTSMTGDAMCALSPPTPLNGSAQNVSLTFTRANCATTGFFAPAGHVLSTSGGMKYFNLTQFAPCGSGADISTLAFANDCNGTTWTGIGGAQLVLPIYQASNLNSSYVKLGELFRSACLTGSGGLNNGYANQFSLYLPTGVPGSTQRFPAEIEIFTDASCTSKVTSYKFPNGLSRDPTEGLAKLTSTSTYTKIFLRQP